PTYGYEIKPGGAGKPTSFFLPAAGYRHRNGGMLNTVGEKGYYWSRTATGINSNSYDLFFSSESRNPAYTDNRSYGITVRCVSNSFDPE
ncbi:MAG: fibrobacter succinogenes major paralogous domain-containing protein, partial [Dysgonamonadaceae bacterium]|nr:fibrobacter succinogenes major paralogous domain-containing protein [Dysgonamonadaceae bacterium]